MSVLSDETWAPVIRSKTGSITARDASPKSYKLRQLVWRDRRGDRFRNICPPPGSPLLPMDSIAATDRFLMLEHLAHAVRRTHELQSLINRQRERIKILNRAGLNTYTAELVLAQLEQSQMLY